MIVPAAGLVLLLGLFVLWAKDLGDNEVDPTATADASPVAQIATVPPPTPTATDEVSLQATEADTRPTSAAGENTPDGEDEECDGDFTKAQKVVVIEDEVRMRAEPDTTQDNVLETLVAGTELTIVGDCYVESEDGTLFWQVRNEETSNTGYVAADFLGPVEE